MTSASLALPVDFSSLPLSNAYQHRLDWTSLRLAQHPSLGLPRALGTAGYKGLMRVLHEAEARGVSLLPAVFEATCQRMVPGETLLNLADTSDCTFGGARGRQGLPRLESKSTGYRLHLSLLVRPQEHPVPLGALALESLTRGPETKAGQSKEQRYNDPDKESLRWQRGVDESEQRVQGRVSLVHVRDREGDDFGQLHDFQAKGRRFIQRLRQPRLLAEAPDHAPDARFTDAAFAGVSGQCARQVTLGPRAQGKHDPRPASEKKAHPARPEREAILHFAAQSLTVRKPSRCPDEWPEQMTLNVLRVWEPSPPKGQQAVEWFLVTSEPLDTLEQALWVLDGYRARWLIEEVFKGLKTGCQYEKLQMESVERLVEMLAFYLPLVTQLLQLRTMAQHDTTSSAREVLSEEQMQAITAAHDFGRMVPAKHRPEPKTAAEALALVARLGGYLGKKGEAGWQVLLRGMVHLQDLVLGMRLGRQLKGPETTKPGVPS